MAYFLRLSTIYMSDPPESLEYVILMLEQHISFHKVDDPTKRVINEAIKIIRYHVWLDEQVRRRDSI